MCIPLQVNSAVKDTLSIRRQELDRLTVSSAIQLALNSKEVQLYTNQSPVLDAHLKLYPGLFAAIDLKLDHTKLHFDREFHKNKAKRKKKILNT